MLGGDGNDTLEGRALDDTLYGGIGSDTLYGGTGNDVLYGGTGQDTLHGDAGADTQFGGDDQDIFVLDDGFGADVIYGGEGGVDVDTLDLSGLGTGVTVTYTGDERGTATDGTDTLNFYGIERVVLTDQNDVLNASSDTVGCFRRCPCDGNDSIDGGSGNDSLTGGIGNDTIDSGSGADTIYAGAGDDLVQTNRAERGDDTVYGGAGNDTIEFDRMTDAVYGGDDDDRIVNADAMTSGEMGSIFGGTGQDTLVLDGSDGGFINLHTVDMTAGEVTYIGATRNTFSEIENVEIINAAVSVSGNSEDNTITGIGDFDNAFDGGAGNDVIDGGGGNDTLTGGAGDDTMTGGTGNDVFVLSAGGGSDTITDFDAGDDGSTVVAAGLTRAGMVDRLDTSALTDVGNALTNQDGTVTANEVQVSGGGGSPQILTFPNGETVEVPDGTIDTSSPESQHASLVAMGVPPCFASGTRIATPGGEVPVERLRVGDLVLTADRGPQPVRWIGRREVVFGPSNPRGDRDKPIRFAPGSLGRGLPRRGLVVSPQHRMLLAGPAVADICGSPEALGPAKALTGRGGVRRMMGKRRVTYHALLFDRHEVIFAEGAPAESFRPGPVTLRGLPEDDRIRIHALYPGLAADPVEGLGLPARPLLTKKQTETAAALPEPPSRQGPPPGRVYTSQGSDLSDEYDRWDADSAEDNAAPLLPPMARTAAEVRR